MAQQEKNKHCDKLSFMLNDLYVTVCVNPLGVVIRDIVKHRVAWVDAIHESRNSAIRFYCGCLYLKMHKIRHPAKITGHHRIITAENAPTHQELT